MVSRILNVELVGDVGSNYTNFLIFNEQVLGFQCRRSLYLTIVCQVNLTFVNTVRSVLIIKKLKMVTM